MERPRAGSVVVVPFPFSNLAEAKLRPALVLASLPHDDLVCCQITSRPYHDFSIPLDASDYALGGLPLPSYVRPTRLVTLDVDLVRGHPGIVSEAKLNDVLEALVTVLRRGSLPGTG